MQKHVNCGAFGSVDKITCHISLFGMNFRPRNILENHFSSFQCIKKRSRVGLALGSS